MNAGPDITSLLHLVLLSQVPPGPSRHCAAASRESLMGRGHRSCSAGTELGRVFAGQENTRFMVQPAKPTLSLLV